MRTLGSRMASVLFLALLLAVATLGFVGCGNQNTTTTDETTQTGEEPAAPEDVVTKFFRAVEKQDASALAGLFDSESLKQIKETLGKDYKSIIKDFFFADMPDTVKFKSLKFDSEIDGKEATVDVIKGKITYKDESGNPATEDLLASDETLTFFLVKEKGKWYISVDTFPDLIATYDIPEPDTNTNTNTNPNPQPAAEYVVCPDCYGSGGWEVGADTTCPYCNEAGVQDVQDYCYDCDGSGVLYDEYGNAWTCDTCGGSGLIWDWVACDYCGGSGLVTGSTWVVCETCEGSGWVLR